MISDATSHQVREHFQAWVPKNLDERLRPDATPSKQDVDWRLASETPRYEYCLFVDDFCIESWDPDSTRLPVVKLLRKDWEPESPTSSPREEEQEPPSPFYDGFTDNDEEDVGWMFLSVDDYVEQYELLGEMFWADLYRRPSREDMDDDLR